MNVGGLEQKFLDMCLDSFIVVCPFCIYANLFKESMLVMGWFFCKSLPTLPHILNFEWRSFIYYLMNSY